MGEPNQIPLETIYEGRAVHKDMWRPSQYDENGKVIERADTMHPDDAKPGRLFNPAPDAAAIVMQEFQQFMQDQASKAPAKE